MTEQMYWLWLVNLSNIHSAKITLLLEKFDTVKDIYNAGEKDFLGIDKIGPKEIRSLCNKDMTTANNISKRIDEIGAYVLCFDDEDYPEALRHCYDPPYVLYVLGERLNWDKMLRISVVGSRECTDYGIKVVNDICAPLAREGVVIVSGMARGIDTAAHKCALEAGAKTVAFLGCGIDVVYPPENETVMRAISKNGAVMSEFAPGTPPYGKNFPIRNRLIAAFSHGVLVVEAREKSGTLITARWALENGKDVFAVPADYNREGSAGCNYLIKSGMAKSVCSAKDILEEYAYEFESANMGSFGKSEPVYIEDTENEQVQSLPKINKYEGRTALGADKEKFDINNPRYDVLDEKQKDIILLLAECDRHIDEICRNVDMKPSEVSAALTIMELEGFVVALAGKMFRLDA